jgi:surface antigen
MYSLSRSRRPDLARLAALGLLSLSLGACSMPMGSLMGGDDKPDVTATGATESGRAAGRPQLATAAAPAPSSIPLSPADWNYARGALGLALTSNETGPPVPWANPETGARGNFAPSAAAVTADGRTCRDFVATRSEHGKEVQLSGRACRTADGQWDISETKKTAL